GQEGRQGEGGEAQGQRRLNGEEAVGRGNRERVYKENQPGRHGHGAGDVETLRRRPWTTPRDESLSQDRRHGSDRHVDEHDRSPSERRGEDPARDRAGREPRRQDRDEDPERPIALLPLGERGREDRQSRGGRHGRGDALNRPRDNEGEERWRKSGRQGRYGEEDDSEKEQALLAVDVAGSATDHQESGQGEPVHTGHPLALRERGQEFQL